MAPEPTAVGGLIYAAMVAYLLAAAAFRLKRPRPGGVLHACGFLAAAAAFAVLWAQIGHPPIKDLFGVFLCLGALMYPLSVLCRRLLGVSSPAEDAAIGFVLLLPAGFIFRQGAAHLMPILQSPLLGIHVGAYMLAYAVLFKAGSQAFRSLLRRGATADEHELAACRLIRLGFPLLTLGLVLGALWGSTAWGDYWQWDPKELWSLAMWLVYAGYSQVRSMYGTRHPRLNAGIAAAGAVVILVTLLWVNLGRIFAGLHSYAA